MQEPYDNDVRFKLDAELDTKVQKVAAIDNHEPDFDGQVDELRLEKLSHRITIITVLIPVLIIIVLAMAYFDIKNRMARSQDSDLLEFGKLSADLDSRFSSLSLRQAALEESVAATVQEQSQTAAKITPLISQLKTLEATLNQMQKSIAVLVPQKEFQASRESLLKQINEITQTVNKVAATVDKADNEIEAMTRSIKSEIAKMATTLNGRDAQIDQLQTRVNQQIERLSKLERSTTQLDNTKITKADLDLALRLESMKIEQKINALESKISGQSSTYRTPSTPAAVRPSTVPAAPKASPAPVASQPQKRGGIEEQTIGR